METYKGLSIVAAAIILSLWYKKQYTQEREIHINTLKHFICLSLVWMAIYNFGLIGFAHVVSCYGQKMLVILGITFK